MKLTQIQYKQKSKLMSNKFNKKLYKIPTVKPKKIIKTFNKE